MSRTLGTVVRGVRAPIFREGDNAVQITADTVLNALKDNCITARDGYIEAITESVVALCQGNYATVEQIAADVLVLAVGIGRADEHRVHEAGGGDLLAPDDDIVKQFSRDHVDDDEQDRYDHHRARDDPVKIFQ